MESSDRYRYWIDMAEYDLETARAMLTTRRYLYVGFMCHQTVEKAIKAYHWKKNNSEPDFLHNLLRLADKAGIIDLLTDEQIKLINRLNPLNIEARYPREKDKLLCALNDDVCKELVKETEDFLIWIKTR